MVVEGPAVRVTDRALWLRLAALWETKLEWPFEVAAESFREQSSEVDGEELNDTGTPHVFAVAPSKVLAFGKGDPFSQTRYRFP